MIVDDDDVGIMDGTSGGGLLTKAEKEERKSEKDENKGNAMETRQQSHDQAEKRW